MNEEHVIKSFQAWDEDRLDQEERRVVRRHLANCEPCRDYFEKMSEMLGNTDPSFLPRLETDPFLPTRIRAIVEAGERDPLVAPADSSAATVGKQDVVARGRKTTPYGKAAAWLRVSFAGAMTVIAVVTGVYLGRGLATTETANGDAEIVTAYYEAVAQTGFAGDWGDVVEVETEEQR